ncbi:uncharacterized protein BCR38DRAFT_406794 [Pseudomassariella vexata]|uniref:Uncharacterized protein n=1 Tax=Pseudomassariella vexata TaxID=1141098 RepID=A0A1Y2ECC8_9PEZI|nr:uncharacterized protein BCR38DRAFT_406794 [Pseudomassariella vexata]ORY68916.1 hypothetical protein BCR38DRAFT_406794 [Pseudomassariella vexata]
MPRYTVTEPHPTVVQDTYTHHGRGGAGNYFRAPVTTSSTGVPTTTSMPLPPKTKTFYSGRGGAGNAHTSSDCPTISFDEVYKVQSHINEKPVGHVGRGGAGNVYGSSHDAGGNTSSNPKGKDSDAVSQRSVSSSGSTLSGFMGRLSGFSLRSHH